MKLDNKNNSAVREFEQWVDGELHGTNEQPSHEQPASARVEENTKMYTRESRQTKQHVHTCMFCGQSGTEISNGEQLRFLGNRAEELSSLLAGMTTEREELREVNKGLVKTLRSTAHQAADGSGLCWDAADDRVFGHQTHCIKLRTVLNHAEQGEGSDAS